MPKAAVVSLDSFRTLRRSAGQPAPDARWRLATLAGRLTELSGAEATAGLTLAFGLVLEAQRRGEPAAWLTPERSSFFPPDAAAGGVDLDALVVVRLPRVEEIPVAAELLARSGAFALLVLDLGPRAEVPAPLQMRLVGLAQKHAAAILCLTRKQRDAPSLGSLVSLRAEAAHGLDGGGGETWSRTVACRLQVLKDKRRGPGWGHVEVCYGPDGLR